MAQDPAFLFYSSDFLTGTQFFTYEQMGQYIKLLCLQHQHGRLQEKHMLHICRSPDSDVMQKFSKDATGLYYNERLEEEVGKRKKYCDSRRVNRTKKNNPPGEDVLQTTELHEGSIENDIEKKEVKGQKKQTAEILFTESDTYPLEKFTEAFSGEQSKYKMFNHEYYYEAVLSWAESNRVKKINWIATARGFMLRDSRDKKAVLKGQNLLQNGKQANNREQQYEAVERALAARYTGDKSE